MTEGTPPPVLRLELPGVVSWSRPRRARGGVRYPSAYAQARDAWGLLVARAVRQAHWRPPPEARYRVAVVVSGGGRRDLDRVCTAVLDALQTGHAVRDDCLVDELRAARIRLPGGERPATLVDLTILAGARRGRQPGRAATAAPPTRGAAQRRPR
jgi:Holliday junction resolvase RusA-like endonuclease